MLNLCNYCRQLAFSFALRLACCVIPWLLACEFVFAAPQEFTTTVELGPGNEQVAAELLSATKLNRHSSLYSAESRWKDFSLDLSGRDLQTATIHSNMDALFNLNFDNSNLSNSDLRETRFRNCSFRSAKLRNLDISVEGCDLTDADISGCKIRLTKEQLLSTLNYKRKNLSNLNLSCLANGVDLKGFDLRNSSLLGSKFTKCDFTDANILGSVNRLNAEELRSTDSYKRKDLSNTGLYGDLSGLSFAGFDLRGVRFKGRIKGCDFSNANISGVTFRGSISKKQLYSTRNYKERDLLGVRFHFCALRNFDFSGQCLGYFVACDLEGAKFDNAAFSNGGYGTSERYSCGFGDSCVLSFEQFSSTRIFQSKHLPRWFNIRKELREKFEAKQVVQDQRALVRPVKAKR